MSRVLLIVAFTLACPTVARPAPPVFGPEIHVFSPAAREYLKQRRHEERRGKIRRDYLRRAAEDGRLRGAQRAAHPEYRAIRLKPRVYAGAVMPRASAPRPDLAGPTSGALRSITRCYLRRLETRADLAATATLSWRIGSDGRPAAVHLARGSLRDQELLGCLVRVVERLRFPAGQRVDVAWPLTFSPASPR